MEAVAARDEVAFDLMHLAIFFIAHLGVLAVETDRLHVLRLVNRGQALLGPHFHEIARHLGLAIHHHALATGKAMQVDAVALALEQQLDTVMGQAFLIHAGVGTRRLEQVHRDLFKHAGANAAQHVVGAALLEDDVVDASLVQQLAQKQARGARADDGDLSAHETCLLENIGVHHGLRSRYGEQD